jgi:hypothetical protein
VRPNKAKPELGEMFRSARLVASEPPPATSGLNGFTAHLKNSIVAITHEGGALVIRIREV